MGQCVSTGLFFFFQCAESFMSSLCSCVLQKHAYIYIYIYIDCFYFSYDLLESRLQSSGGVKLC